MVFNLFKDKVAVIPLEGPIMESSGGLFPSFMPSSINKAEEYLEKIKDSKRYKGLILEINSPGGSPYKSRSLARKIGKLDMFKIAKIEEQGTSGAYWVASACDVIIADELSSVGGIGTLSIRPDFSELMEKLGIKVDIQSEGEHKEEGMPFSKPTKVEKEHRKKMVKEINELFKQQIKSRRRIKGDSEALEGKVYLGKEAKKEGLIDHLGGRDEAIKVFKRTTGLTDIKIKDFSQEIRKGPSLLDIIR